MTAHQLEQEPTFFPVTTRGFVAFILGGLHILCLVIFMAIWSTADDLIGATPLTTWETVAALVAVAVGFASAIVSIIAIAASGERARVEFSILALGLAAPAFLISLLV